MPIVTGDFSIFYHVYLIYLFTFLYPNSILNNRGFRRGSFKMEIKSILIFVISGVCCGIMTFTIACYRSKPPEMIRRVEYALISSMGYFSISWLGVRYFPDYVTVYDAIPLSFLIGLIGIGNVVDVIAKKYGIKNDNEDLQK